MPKLMLMCAMFPLLVHLLIGIYVFLFPPNLDGSSVSAPMHTDVSEHVHLRVPVFLSLGIYLVVKLLIMAVLCLLCY